MEGILDTRVRDFPSSVESTILEKQNEVEVENPFCITSKSPSLLRITGPLSHLI